MPYLIIFMTCTKVLQKRPKELWNTLEVEYGIDDAGIKRFAISNFTSYKMVDNKYVGYQIHEYQELLRQVEKDETIFNETLKFRT